MVFVYVMRRDDSFFATYYTPSFVIQKANGFVVLFVAIHAIIFAAAVKGIRASMGACDLSFSSDAMRCYEVPVAYYTLLFSRMVWVFQTPRFMSFV